jgi:type IV secretory pathway VirB6-like protein
MATYTYQLNWTRKFLIWVTSVAGGVLNLLALSIVLGLLVSERP